MEDPLILGQWNIFKIKFLVVSRLGQILLDLFPWQELLVLGLGWANFDLFLGMI